MGCGASSPIEQPLLTIQHELVEDQPSTNPLSNQSPDQSSDSSAKSDALSNTQSDKQSSAVSPLSSTPACSSSPQITIQSPDHSTKQSGSPAVSTPSTHQPAIPSTGNQPKYTLPEVKTKLSAPKQSRHKHTLSQTEERFSILKVLGEGASCKVVAVRERATGQFFAMKIMDKSEPYNRVLFESESAILKALQHENILTFVESYEDRQTYHLLTVLCQGGELFDRVRNGSFSEKTAASLCRQMLEALAYCHSKGIVHRDLKPENFVFATKDENSTMKLIDFGCAKVVDDSEVVSDVAGSPYYCAPEILGDSIVRTGKVWKASDMWSVGVIVFLLVCGFPPFNGDSQDKIFRKIRKGKFRFPKASELGGVELSDSVKDLITKLLQMSPGDRLSAQKALEHPWITGLTASEVPLPSVVIDALNSFRAQCRLKKAAARVLLNKMTDDDRANLKAVFSQFDVNGDGQLGSEEIAQLMSKIGKSDAEARAIMDNMDEDGDGGVSYGEFEQAAALGQLQTEADIRRSFEMFDLDHDGFITHMEIERVCNFLTHDAVMGMVREVDQNEDGRITFEEWLQAMSGRSQLAQQKEQIMAEKRRSMQFDNRSTADKLEEHKRKSGRLHGNVERVKEEEESKTNDSVQQPNIVQVGAA